MADQSKRRRLLKLHQIIVTQFDESELRTLCFKLDIDYDDLPDQGRAGKARELVTYMARHSRLNELERAINSAFPGQLFPILHLPSTNYIMRIISVITFFLALLWLIFYPDTMQGVPIGGLVIAPILFWSLSRRQLDIVGEPGKKRQLFLAYRFQYLRYLVHRHQYFDVKGLSTQGPHTLALPDVFVELSMVSTPPHQISASIVRLAETDVQAERHMIWDILSARQLAGRNLVIIGPPGSGKTTLLKHITLTLASGWINRLRFKIPRMLPILLFLREHANVIRERDDVSLPELIRDSLTQWGPIPPQGWFAQILHQGRCLVLLDGLDEVAEPALRLIVVRWVERQMVKYSRSRFVVSSRPYGYLSSPLWGVTVYEVRPFSNVQIIKFVHNWYLAHEMMSTHKKDRSVRIRSQEGAEDLLKRIHITPTLEKLAENPLLLTMIATVHRFHSRLPGRRVELYAQICEVFLGTWREARGLSEDLTPLQKQLVLQPLAYYAMQKKRREISLSEASEVIQASLKGVNRAINAEAFLKMIEHSSGLLLEMESGHYGFAHLTFQEYLAAMHIQEEKLESFLIPNVEDPWWHEAIRLYVARASATPIIAACLMKDSVPALILAIECAKEARALEPRIATQLEDRMSKWLEDADEERYRIAAEAKLELRLRGLARANENILIDTSPISCAEYQLFLDEKALEDNNHHPDHWSTLRFTPGFAIMPIVGVRYKDALAFYAWLSKRASDGSWHFRLPKPGELATLKSAGSAIAHNNGTAGYWAMGNNFEITSTIPNPSPRSLILQIITDYVRVNNLDRGLARKLANTYSIEQILEQLLSLDSQRAGEVARELEKTCKNMGVIDVEQAQRNVGVLNRISALALVPSLDRIQGLLLVLNRARAGIHKLILILEDNLRETLNGTGKGRLDGTLITKLVSDLAKARDLSKDLTGVVTKDLNLSYRLKHKLDLSNGLNDVYNSAYILAQAKYYYKNQAVFGSNFAEDLLELRKLDSVLEQKLAKTQALARSLDLAISLEVVFNRRSIGIIPAPRARSLLRIYLLELASDTFIIKQQQRKPASYTDLVIIREIRKPSLSDYLNLFMALVIIEMRTEKKLPAVESIWLIKERKVD